ncbi:NERD domain-containing protein [Shewanella algae]|uniref:nuclease-related domain-containing protein n=1 Tax=Shewanella algae TaxID=38313 RepID=UPI001AAD5287|nr:nuclease-related domain-containing protein [Shewanella algae]MBO2554019.1 NERD domain-containing protein [Shewanella algae]MBO2592468.1 NERD domain-containing protein [Shewanella algae]
MILKSKSLQVTQSPQAYAGQKQEQDVAFFLRRAFKDHPQVMVINDFKFNFNGETAQIDHLIIYTYGFVLIESKSIKGRVNVNQQGEWTRSHQNQWFGIASPLKQVELQQALLLQLLTHHKREILGKLLGIKQQGFKLRVWDHLCAVSSDAIINRDTMPSEISQKLVKTEFLVDKLNEVMNLKSSFMRLVNFSDTRPDFSQDELKSICDFLIAQDISSPSQQETGTPLANAETSTSTVATHVQAEVEERHTQIQESRAADYQAQPHAAALTAKLSCKHCGEPSNYIPMYGKFGYYIKCHQCSKNTPMKQSCPQCQSKNTRVQKRAETYTLNCQECQFTEKLI